MDDQYHYDSSGNYLGKTSSGGPNREDDGTFLLVILIPLGVFLFGNWILYTEDFDFMLNPDKFNGLLSWFGWYYHFVLIWPMKAIFGISNLNITAYQNLNFVLKIIVYLFIIIIPIWLWAVKEDIMNSIAGLLLIIYIGPVVLFLLIMAYYWLLS